MTVSASFVLNTAELFGRDASRFELRQEVTLGDMELSGASSRSQIVDGRLLLELLLERTGPLSGTSGALEVAQRDSQSSRISGVLVTGSARGRWSVPCRRCLEPTQGNLLVEIDERFELAPRDGETWVLQQQSIDLGPMLRELALLSLPLAPLCAADCEGPAPDRFPTGPSVDHDSLTDPRWSVLGELTFDN